MAEINSSLLMDEYQHKLGIVSRAYKMLNAAGAVTVGSWVPFHMFNRGTLELIGSLVGTVQIFGTNIDDPAVSDLGTKIGADVAMNNANQLVYLSNTYRFVRVAISAWTSGSITAILAACSSGN